MTEKDQRPVIGITGPDQGGAAAWLFSAFAVCRAGGWPRRIRPGHPVSIEEVDGLIIGGGVDLDPALYGGDDGEILAEIKSSPGTPKNRILGRLVLPLIYLLRRLFSLKHEVSRDVQRDAFEVGLVRGALAMGKPVLGICRGAQMLNAALGGSLHREIRGFYTESPYIKSVLPKKRISVVPNTLLASLWPLAVYRVNSLHHQAMDRIASSLRISAREDNGLVQAVEDPLRPFVLGVQWHPEFLPHLKTHQLIFERLVQCAERQAHSI